MKEMKESKWYNQKHKDRRKKKKGETKKEGGRRSQKKHNYKGGGGGVDRQLKEQAQGNLDSG